MFEELSLPEMEKPFKQRPTSYLSLERALIYPLAASFD
jgi:hypothetical protein